MAKRIIWSKKAKEDKIRILKYWQRRNKSNEYPIKLNNLFKEAVLWIVKNPTIRRMTDYKGTYMKIVRDYQVIFEEDESTVYILTVWDTRQNPNKLKEMLDKKGKLGS